MRQISVPFRRRLVPAAGAVLLAAVLAACSSSPKALQPAPLLPFTQQVPATQVWKVQLPPTHALLLPVAHSGQLYVASADGSVSALDGQTGRSVWRHEVGQPLSAGVGTDGQSVAVVTRDNDLVVLAEGRPLWRTRLNARVFTPPLVAGKRVFVLSGERSVTAFDADTGAQLWHQTARNTDQLVLQQAGVLTAVGNTLVAGIAGRLVGLNPNTGAPRWEVPVASPRGVNEIERLVDLVAHVGRTDDQLCVRAFQSALGCVDAARGSLQWTRSANGSVGVDADDDHVYGAESNGRVQAWRRTSGDVAWSSDILLHRGLTAPLAAGRSTVWGDATGHLHFLSREDGTLLNRLSTDGSPLVSAPLLVDNTLVAVTRNGGVYAWRPE